MYQHHVQRLQHMVPGDFAKRPYFGTWFNSNHRLHGYILFTDDEKFDRGGVHNTFLLCGQMRFPIALWKGTFVCVSVSIRVRSDDIVIGPSPFESSLAGDLYIRLRQEEFAKFWRMYF
jgi:hypothetical protein